jgi:magnesium transporter
MRQRPVLRPGQAWSSLDVLAPKRPAEPPPAAPKVHRAQVDCAAYVHGRREPGCATPREALARVRERGEGFVWVGLHEPDTVEMTELARTFDLHELAVEDAVHSYQRPKLDTYASAMFMVLRTVRYVEHQTAATASKIVQTGEIMVFLGADFLITVRHGEHSGLTTVRAQLEADAERLAMGPDAVVYAIVDRVVDHYFVVSEAVEDDMDEMETSVFDPHTSVTVEQIYHFKQEIQQLRRSVVPLVPALRSLAGGHTPFISAPIQQYFRDAADHLEHVADQVSSFDETIISLISALQAQLGTEQNQDMRKISAWAAIGLVPTAIAGIYGMNFTHMPELDWTFGYPMSLLIMLVICLLLHRILRKRGWL